MAEPFQSGAWQLIGKEAHNVDAFLTPSEYYKDLFISKTGISGKNFHVIPLGLDPGDLTSIIKKDNWPAIGYFCRV